MFSNLFKIESQSSRYKSAADDKHLLESDLDIINYEANRGLERFSALTSSIELFMLKETDEVANVGVNYYYVTDIQTFVNHIITQFGLNHREQLNINVQIVDSNKNYFNWGACGRYELTRLEVNKDFIV